MVEMTAALLIAGALLSFYFGVRAIRSTGALPVWRFKRAPAVTPMDPIERARILATSVEELAEEIERQREREAPGYRDIAQAQAAYATAMAVFMNREQERLAPPLRQPAPFVAARHVSWCGPTADACGGRLFDAPNLRRSICWRAPIRCSAR